MHRILRCKYLQGGHLHDQLSRDPQASQPWTQQNRDRSQLPVRSEHRGNNAAAGSERTAAMAAAEGNVGQAARRVPVPNHCREARLQDAGLRLCSKGAPAQRRHPKSALAGVLRPVQSSGRDPVSVHPVQQVLRRLSGKGQCHHALKSQTR